MQRFEYISLTFQFHKEDEVWVGECVELGTSTFGSTLEETEKELIDLVTLHLNTLEDLNERDRFFSENGIQIYYNKPPEKVNLNSVSPEFFVKAHFHNLPVNVA